MLNYDLKKIPEEYSEDLVRVITSLISGDWSSRPKCTELMEDKAFLIHLGKTLS